MTTLHTKHRPSNFDGVIGQDKVVAALKSSLKKETSHTFLFHGPSGTGKTTLARIASKVVGSSDKDIQEIDAATFTGIDDMRAITSGLMYRPFGSNAVKSLILDEAHRLSGQAWASLLKSLEEPSPWVYWFLCTTEPGKVPANIKTRCTSFELKPVPSKELLDLLDEVCEKEKLTLNAGIVELCAKEANGSPRQALVNLGIVSGCTKREEAAALLRSAEGMAEARDLAKVLLNRGGWAQVQVILNDLKEKNPESIRQEVRGYITAVILNANSEKSAGSAAEVLDAFSQPFLSNDGISPVVMACARVLLQ